MAILQRRQVKGSYDTVKLLTFGLGILLILIYIIYVSQVSQRISAAQTGQNHSCLNESKQVEIHPTIICKHDLLPMLKQVIIHRFWASWSFNRKVQTAILSSLRTQSNARVIVWTLPSTLSSVLAQTQRLQELSCPSNSTLEVRSIRELQDLLSNSQDPILRICAQSLHDTPNNMVVLSDVIRFMALYFYGGIYADADVIFMRDMRDLHGLAFAYKWDRNVLYYNTAVMGMPVKSPVVLQIIYHFQSCNADTFYPTRIHEALSCNSGVCNELIMMPTALFGPVSAPQSNWQWQSPLGGPGSFFTLCCLKVFPYFL